MKKKVILIIITILLIINIIIITPIGKTLTINVVNVFDAIQRNVTGGINQVKDYLINNKESSKENEILTNDNNSLTNKITDLENSNTILVAENEQQKNLLEGNTQISESIKTYGTNSKIINGQIIVRNINSWNNTATINLGEIHGINKVGLAVVINGKLAGFVNNFSKNNSEISLITNDNVELNIPVMAIVDNKEINGIISNYDSSTNELNFIPLNSLDLINIGSPVFTNGFQENVCKGIPIGSITNVENQGGPIVYKIKLDSTISNNNLIGVVTND